MHFVDDIVLILEWREWINEKVELWRQYVEAYDFRINRSKIEYTYIWNVRLTRGAQIIG